MRDKVKKGNRETEKQRQTETYRDKQKDRDQFMVFNLLRSPRQIKICVSYSILQYITERQREIERDRQSEQERERE